MKETVSLAVKNEICHLCFPMGAGSIWLNMLTSGQIRCKDQDNFMRKHKAIRKKCNNQKTVRIQRCLFLFYFFIYWMSLLSEAVNVPFVFPEQELKLYKLLFYIFIKPVTLNILIHFCGGEFLKTVTQLHTKCIVWFYRVKRDERAQWSVIGKPDWDTLLQAGTKSTSYWLG